MSDVEVTAGIEAALRSLCANESTLLDADPAWAALDFHLACAWGDERSVDRFLRENAKLAIEPGGPFRWQPIEYACFSKRLRSHPEGIIGVVRQLLDEGADPSSGHFTEESGQWLQTVLYAASGIENNAELTGMLLRAGADVNESLPVPDANDPSVSPWGPEALYHSCEFSGTRCLTLLLEAKPRPLYVSYCLARALDFENPEAIAALVKHGADPDFRVPWAQNRTHLHRAIINERSAQILKILIEAGGDIHAKDSHGRTAYQDAVRFGLVEQAQLLESHGAVDASDADRKLGSLMQGLPAEIDATIDGELMQRAARRGDVSALAALISAGGEISGAAWMDMPPLHEAAWWGRPEAVQFLIGKGADLHQRNRYGGDALGTTIHGSMYCFDSGKGPAASPADAEKEPDPYARIVETLLKAGAKLPDKIAGSPGVVRVLKAHGMEE